MFPCCWAAAPPCRAGASVFCAVDAAACGSGGGIVCCGGVLSALPVAWSLGRDPAGKGASDRSRTCGASGTAFGEDKPCPDGTGANVLGRLTAAPMVTGPSEGDGGGFVDADMCGRWRPLAPDAGGRGGAGDAASGARSSGGLKEAVARGAASGAAVAVGAEGPAPQGSLGTWTTGVSNCRPGPPSKVGCDGGSGSRIAAGSGWIWAWALIVEGSGVGDAAPEGGGVCCSGCDPAVMPVTGDRRRTASPRKGRSTAVSGGSVNSAFSAIFVPLSARPGPATPGVGSCPSRPVRGAVRAVGGVAQKGTAGLSLGGCVPSAKGCGSGAGSGGS